MGEKERETERKERVREGGRDDRRVGGKGRYGKEGEGRKARR